MNLRKASQEEKNQHFIDKSHKVHPVGRYGYEFVKYINSGLPVDIKCNECGKMFLQAPDNHYAGRVCPECGRKKANDKLRYSKEIFETEGRLRFGDKCNYSEVIYIDSQTNVIISCNDCG